MGVAELGLAGVFVGVILGSIPGAFLLRRVARSTEKLDIRFANAYVTMFLAHSIINVLWIFGMTLQKLVSLEPGLDMLVRASLILPMILTHSTAISLRHKLPFETAAKITIIIYFVACSVTFIIMLIIVAVGGHFSPD